MAVLCQLADPEHYNPFDWDTRQDDADRAYWLGLFEAFPAHMEHHLREDGLTGDDFDNRWATFVQEYTEGMTRLRRQSNETKRQSTIELGAFRQAMLNRHGWPDPYLKVKQRENAAALRLWPGLIERVDSASDSERWDMLFRGLLAGNIFDLGCPDTIDMHRQGQIDFTATFDRLAPRPWFIDDVDPIQARLTSSNPWRQALFFVDNSGTDIVLGVLPFVREMGRRGIRIVLAANSGPALNDITHAELVPLLTGLADMDAALRRLIDDGLIQTIENGSTSPLIDLSRVSDACNAAAARSDLIVLQGMGRGVESNWRQRFRCDVWRVALVKDRTVAGWLGADLFSPVCRYDKAGTVQVS